METRNKHLRISVEELSSLPPKQEATVTAAMIIQDSLKARLLKAITVNGPFAGVPELMEFVRRPGSGDSFGAHEVTHLLYSLNKQGYIKYKTGRSGTKTDLLTDIVPTAKAKAEHGIPAQPPRQQFNPEGGRMAGTSRAGHAVGKDLTEQKYHGATAVGGPIERLQAEDVPQPVTPVYQPEAGEPESHKPLVNEEPSSEVEWPELQVIRAKAQEARAVSRRAHALLEAAALLEEEDPDEAERLLARAAALQTGAELTELEAEYLRFAEIAEDAESWSASHTK